MRVLQGDRPVVQHVRHRHFHPDKMLSKVMVLIQALKVIVISSVLSHYRASRNGISSVKEWITAHGVLKQ